MAPTPMSSEEAKAEKKRLKKLKKEQEALGASVAVAPIHSPLPAPVVGDNVEMEVVKKSRKKSVAVGLSPLSPEQEKEERRRIRKLQKEQEALAAVTPVPVLSVPVVTTGADVEVVKKSRKKSVDVAVSSDTIPSLIPPVVLVVDTAEKSKRRKSTRDSVKSPVASNPTPVPSLMSPEQEKEERRRIRKLQKEQEALAVQGVTSPVESTKPKKSKKISKLSTETSEEIISLESISVVSSSPIPCSPQVLAESRKKEKKSRRKEAVLVDDGISDISS